MSRWKFANKFEQITGDGFAEEDIKAIFHSNSPLSSIEIITSFIDFNEDFI